MSLRRIVGRGRSVPRGTSGPRFVGLGRVGSAINVVSGAVDARPDATSGRAPVRGLRLLTPAHPAPERGRPVRVRRAAAQVRAGTTPGQPGEPPRGVSTGSPRAQPGHRRSLPVAEEWGWPEFDRRACAADSPPEQAPPRPVPEATCASSGGAACQSWAHRQTCGSRHAVQRVSVVTWVPIAFGRRLTRPRRPQLADVPRGTTQTSAESVRHSRAAAPRGGESRSSTVERPQVSDLAGGQPAWGEHLGGGGPCGGMHIEPCRPAGVIRWPGLGG